MLTPIYILQVTHKSPGEADHKISYFDMDSQSGGYPYFQSHPFRAYRSKGLEEIIHILDYTVNKERDTCYSPKTGYSEHCLPGTLRSIVGGTIKNDGKYEFKFEVVEVSGKSLTELVTKVMYSVELDVVQNSAEYNVPTVRTQRPGIDLTQE